MKNITMLALILLNLVALFAGGFRFFVTFADVPVQAIPLACFHAYHHGIADMQNYLIPCLPWLAGAMLINFSVAVVLLIRLNKPVSP